MVFSDLFFLFVFLPAFILLYSLAGIVDHKLTSDRLSTSHPCANTILVIFSLLFYAWGEPVYILLMIGAVAVNYVSGRVIDSASRHRKAALVAGIAANIAILCTFKYANFLAENLSGIGIQIQNPNISLPIGISFYIFQSISYITDVYRREAPAQRNFFNLLLYISMFPQLIAGPIVRYSSVASEISSRHASAEDMADGVFRFLIGLGKKVIIANQLSEIAEQFLGSDLSGLTTGGAWIGILAFTFQIYFDFSGYSDMAIGIGRCLGFHFCENFNHPYCSRSITDFWRRWHMSLGSFFRDYVYIPLGGNRAHQFANILAVWFLTGLWHGASWNFVIWGLYFGGILIIEKYALLPRVNSIPRPMMHLYALLIIVIGWGIFYFDDMGRMADFYNAFFGLSGHGHWDYTAESAIFDHFWLWMAAIVFCMPVRRIVSALPSKFLGHGTGGAVALSLGARTVVAAAILIISVALLIGATNNAFLYTRF